MTPEHLPAFSDALYVVIGLAVVVGFIVIFQAMYTAVLERTREIGILKSLGASQGYVVDLVLRETAFLALISIFLGVGGTFLLKAGMDVRFPAIPFPVSLHWILAATAIAFSGEPWWVLAILRLKQLAKIPSKHWRTNRRLQIRVSESCCTTASWWRWRA